MKKKLICLISILTLLIGTTLSANAITRTVNVAGGSGTTTIDTTRAYGTLSNLTNTTATKGISLSIVSVKNGVSATNSNSASNTKTPFTCYVYPKDSSYTPSYVNYTYNPGTSAAVSGTLYRQ